MKWLLGVYTGRFNRRHKLFGHLFVFDTFLACGENPPHRHRVGGELGGLREAPRGIAAKGGEISQHALADAAASAA